MGAFKTIHTEILEFKARGRSIEDTYIYFKDYIDFKDLINIWEGA
jgi:hypothetical protein